MQYDSRQEKRRTAQILQFLPGIFLGPFLSLETINFLVSNELSAFPLFMFLILITCFMLAYAHNFAECMRTIFERK